MTSAGRWTIVVVVLALAGVVALWPRGDDDHNATSPQARTATTRSAGPPESDAALAQLRRRVAMQPCPSPSPGAPPPAGPLAGVTARCLGTPGTVNLGAALAGKTTLLNVWASWCPVCREEMPVLAEYARRSGSIPVVGVNVREPASSALEFMASVGVHYPSVHDRGRTVQKALRVPPVVPLNYLVLPDGSVERITQPLVFRSPDEIAAAVRRHVGEQQ